MASVDACMALAVNHYGRLDGVANCVGSLLLKPAHLTSAAEWHATLATNLGSAFATVRAAARAMMKTGGSIVLVSSVAARLGLANHEAIAAAKAGVGGLVISAAAAYAARGIRVNAVAPGMVRTPLTARLTQSEAALKRSMVWLPTWHEARDVLEDIGVDHTDVLQALQRHNALDQRRELLTLYGLIAARLEAPDSRSELTDSATTAPVPCR